MKYLDVVNGKKAELKCKLIRIEFRMEEDDEYIHNDDIDGRVDVNYSSHRNRSWSPGETFGEVADPDQKSRRGKLRCNDINRRFYDKG